MPNPCGPSIGGVKIAEGAATVQVRGGDGVTRTVVISARRGRLRPGQISPGRLLRMLQQGRTDGIVTVREAGGTATITLDLSTSGLKTRNKDTRYDPSQVPAAQRDAYARVALASLRPDANETSDYVDAVLIDNMRIEARENSWRPVDALSWRAARSTALAAVAAGRGIRQAVQEAAASAGDPAERARQAQEAIDAQGEWKPELSEGCDHVTVGAERGGERDLEATCRRCGTARSITVNARDLPWWKGADSGAAAAVLGMTTGEAAGRAFPYLGAEEHALLDGGLCAACGGGPAPGGVGGGDGGPRRFEQIVGGLRDAVSRMEGDLERIRTGALSFAETQDPERLETLKQDLTALVEATRFHDQQNLSDSSLNRTVVGDLSHHLATPTAALGLTLSGMRRSAARGNIEGLGEMAGEVDSLCQNISERLDEYRDALADGEKGRFTVGEALQLGLKHAGPAAARDDGSGCTEDAELEGSMFLMSRAMWAASTNAKNAMEDAGSAQKLFDVTAHRTKEGRVRVTISDSGPGMPQKLQRSLRQVGNTSQPGRGLGLGLGTISSVTELHGGRVHVVADPRVGTTLILDLPAAD